MTSRTDSRGGGKYIVLSEVNIVVTSLRRNIRWASHGNQTDREDPLIASFNNLKNALNAITELDELEPSAFLGPFLEVIRSEDTSGPITGLALSTINKFLTYDLIGNSSNVATAVSNMADAVTHARFVGTDPANDEVVLMKILQVLRALLLSPVGAFLTNEAVCEIMQSCFRICFEMRLSELLRKSAEHTLVDMVQVLFSRIPEFKDDMRCSSAMKKLKMRASSMTESAGRGKRSRKSPRVKRNDRKHSLQPHYEESAAQATENFEAPPQQTAADIQSVDSGHGSAISSPVAVSQESLNEKTEENVTNAEQAAETQALSVEQTDSKMPTDGEQGGSVQTEESKSSNEEGKDSEQAKQPAEASVESPTPSEQNFDLSSQRAESVPEGLDELETQSQFSDGRNSINETEYVGNPRGVRFTTSARTGEEVNVGPLVPYGLPCVRELFRFLISLTNPHDRHNSDIMVHIGLSLLMVALEVSRNEIERFPSLLTLVKDDMCRYLFQLLGSDRLSLVAASLRISLLVFESLRGHLKFQLESFLKKLMELITSENPKMTYEVKELSIEAVVQLWHIPGFVTELYLNYDCDFYCSNQFEELSKLLSKNAFPVSGLYTTHLLSLDALLTVVESIESRCNFQPQSPLPSDDERERTQSQSSENEDAPEQGEEPADDAIIDGEIVKPELKYPSRFSGVTPTIEELVRIKQKKKLLQMGTEYFNQKPKKGISFLQEQGLLAMPLDTREVALWLRENHWLDKKQIGEFISDRRNPEILDSFVRTFKFEGLRVDESLRMYLEAFRLPGEAPVIQRLLEAFSAYWSESNHHPFMNLDAAFTLAYAVIMLNTDQHNRNVRKQNEPMNMNQFRRNLKSCNGGEDFDQAMLEEIYTTIKHDEIVLPDEQTGPVRDRWLWNVSLRRGASAEGVWLGAPPLIGGPSAYDGLHHYDRDLFSMIWGPTVSALSFVFDKSLEEIIVQKSISGFQKCALISAHFGMCDVFDNLIISLCKFTSLTSSTETPELAATVFGSNPKAQLAARTAFKLAHRHGDILREGWKNILDFLLPLFRAKLLPPAMVEVEDFVDPTGRISLIREELPLQRSDSSIFSSFYQFMTLGGQGDNSGQKNSTPEDQQAMKVAQECVKELHLEQLVTESKFLRLDSLQELIKALVMASRGPDTHESMGTVYCEDSAIFFLELMLRVVLQNRDRILSIWQPVRDHLYTIVVTSSDHNLLLERAVVGLIRLAIRLLHREDVAEQILASLQILLMIKPFILPKVSRQIGYGLHELLRTNAANIHSRDDWMTCFTMMRCVGAGALPPPIVHLPTGCEVEGAEAVEADQSSEVPTEDQATEARPEHHRAQSDTEAVVDDRASQLSDRGYTSDSELYEQSQAAHPAALAVSDPAIANLGDTRQNRSDGELEKLQNSEDKVKANASTIQVIPPPPSPSNQFTLQLGEELRQHDMRAMVKSCETLAFLVRDAAHITPENFELCVRCIRTFVEASINGVNRVHHGVGQDVQSHSKQDKKKLKKRKERDNKRSARSHTGAGQSGMGGRYGQGNSQHSDDELSAETVPGGYHTISLQLLDLMHTLHTRAASIYSSWAKEEKQRLIEEMEGSEEGDEEKEKKEPTINAEASTLWDKCWCPLLQGIARLCCDARRQVRTSALTYLQRALLVHDLQTLTGKEWESCFNKVLFPLLTKLLENISPADPVGMEETRMRGATLLSKVFLQHLNPLLTLPTFTALWLTILDFMDKYMHVGKSDLLFEAIPESLKNMLLVMDTAGIFHSSDSPTDYTSLWDVTWERIDCFLPTLKEEVFKPPTPEPPKKELVAPTANELSRDGQLPAASDTPHTYPYAAVSASHPVSIPQVTPVGVPMPNPMTPPLPHSFPPAGIIPANVPKVTPPASLNVMPPFSPHGNVMPLYQAQEVSPTNPNLPPTMSAPKAPIVMGLGGSLVSSQGYPGQPDPSAATHGHILMSPSQSFILHPPAPSSTLPPMATPVIDPSMPHPNPSASPLLLAGGIMPAQLPILATRTEENGVSGYGGYDVPRKIADQPQPLHHSPQQRMTPHLPASPLGQLPVTAIPALHQDDSSKMLKEPETY